MIGLLVTIFLGNFNSEATVRALRFEEARRGALEQLLYLSKEQLATAQNPKVTDAVVGVALNPKIPFEERVMAVRALVPVGDGQRVRALSKLLASSDSPEGIALARETAKTLFKLGAMPVLAEGLGHGDPEVRQWAARAGMDGKRLCVLLRSDPWPRVRAGAAQGLATRPKHSDCLLNGFKDDEDTVLRSVTESSAILGMSKARPYLVALARTASRSTALRAKALYALGRLGATKLPEAVLRNHLRHGGMAKLAAASVRAIGAAKPAKDVMPMAIASKSGRVLIALARVVTLNPTPESKQYLLQIRSLVNPRYYPTIDGLMERITPTMKLGTSIDREAPEDPAGL
jgi:hypothetical protein